MANSLSTKTEPKLVYCTVTYQISKLISLKYYKPWQLQTGQEERIKNQIAEAEALIEREVADFEARHPKEATPGKIEAEDTNGTSKETAGEPATESPSVLSLAPTDTTNVPAQAEKPALEEHNGEVVV